MKIVQKHTSPYNAAVSDLLVHVYCRQFFSAKRRERFGRGTGEDTGTTSRIGGGLTTAGTGFWCDDTKYSSSSLSDSESQTSDGGDSSRSGWWSASTSEGVVASKRSLRWTVRSGPPATVFVMYTC